jgi:aerobic carbon-monoxide dehydrogenase large subunit
MFHQSGKPGSSICNTNPAATTARYSSRKASAKANRLGVKGAGQAGCIAAPQTIINAILDALAPLGIEHIDMPATPERAWRAIRGARG